MPREGTDPYFEDRLAAAKQHHVLGRIEVSAQGQPEAEPNKDVAHPAIEHSIEELGWSNKAVDNIIDAVDKGLVRIEQLVDDRVRIEFLPIKKLPAELGQVAEADAIKKNMTRRSAVYGAEDSTALTYLQTTDFAVEGYMDDEEQGQRYGRLFIDTVQLQSKRNVYIDPETLHIMDYEYGYAFCVQGGIPWEAIKRIEVIQARRIDRRALHADTTDWPESPESAEAEMRRQIERLRSYLDNKKI